MSTLPAEATWKLIDQLQRNAELDHAREKLMIGSMLMGGGNATLFGKPIKITIEWPDGLPSGFTEDSLRRLGADMVRGAGGDPGRV